MSEEKKQVRREEPRRVTAAARLTPVAARQRRGKAARRVRYAAIDYLATSRRNWKVNFARLFTLVRNLIAYPHTPSNLSAHRPLFLPILLSLSLSPRLYLLPAVYPCRWTDTFCAHEHTNEEAIKRRRGFTGSCLVSFFSQISCVRSAGWSIKPFNRSMVRVWAISLSLSIYIFFRRENTFVNICIIILGSKSFVIRISNRLLEMFSNNSCWFNYFFFF